MPGLKANHLARLLWLHPGYFTHLVNHKIRIAQRYRWIRKKAKAGCRVPLPLVFEIAPTLKCNLRCKMCMLWGDSGWCKNAAPGVIEEELAWGIVEKLLRQAAKSNASFIVNGGEPLLYSHFESLAAGFKKHRFFSTICTNGTLLNKYLDLISGNPYLNFLVSLDGLEKENDLLRGRGVYKKVVDNIKLLKNMKKAPYVGLQFTLMPQNVGCIFEFCEEMVPLGVDWILFNPGWFVNATQARAYEAFVGQNFDVAAKTHLGYPGQYGLDTEEFSRQYSKISSRKWPIQISCYFKKPAEDMRSYVTAQMRKRVNGCYKQWVRMDIAPSGKVTPCIRFPDLFLGDLKEQGAEEIWNSAAFGHFRDLLQTADPGICSQCNSTYLYDPAKKHL